MQHFRLSTFTKGVATFAMLAFGFAANAFEITLENKLQFDINDETNEAVCTKFMIYAMNNDGLADIPDEVEWEGKTYPVVGIGYNACINNGLLTKLVLGKNIRYMDEQACDGSNKLDTVVFNDKIESIGTFAFRGCSSLKELVLPPSLKIVGDYAFASCPFETFTIPATVDSVGNNPFRSGTALKEIIVEGDKYKFENGALLTADGKRLITVPAGNGLTEYTIPDGVTYVGPNSVRNNPTLETLTIPEGVVAVGEYSCGAMPKLTTINLPASVTTIEPAAFYYNASLTTMNVASGSPFSFNDGWLLSTDGKTLIFSLNRSGDVVIPEGIEKIEDYGMYYLSSMTTCTMPKSMKHIGRGAFASCSGLTEMKLNEGLEYIGISCFQSCRSLTDVNFPSTLKTLDKQAFTYCYALKSPKLNQGLEVLGDMCFYGDNSFDFTEVTVPGTVKEWGGATFYNCSMLQKAVVEEGITEIPSLAFSYCGELQSCSLPEGLKVIGGSAFQQNKSLTDIAIPSTVEVLGDGAFNLCTSIEELTVPDGVTMIPNFCFVSMKALRHLNLPDNITFIDHHGIHGCDSVEEINLGKKLIELAEKGCSLNHKITNLVFPETLVTFGEYSINFNTGMTDLYVMATKPAELEYDFFDPETYAFPGYERVTLHVPHGTLEDYANAPIWEKFVEIVDDLVNPTESLRSVGDAKVIATKVFDLQGNRVKNPVNGQVYVKELILDNGQTVVVKEMGI